MKGLAVLFAVIFLLMLVGPFRAHAQFDVMNGLVGYWKFDEGNGTSASDSSGNGNNGTLIGDPTWTEGNSGYALYFNGSNYVDCGNAASLHVQNYSLSAWIKPSIIGDTEHRIISNGGYGNTNGAIDFVIATSGQLVILNQLGAYGQDECWSQSRFLISINSWSLVTATYDATTGNAKLYVNGDEVNTTLSVLRAPNPDPVYNMHIGAMGGGTSMMYFIGSIDEVRIYNRTLSPEEVAQMIPEFPSVPTISLFLATTIIAVIAYTGMRHRKNQPRARYDAIVQRAKGQEQEFTSAVAQIE